jgi:hypothetical protein
VDVASSPPSKILPRHLQKLRKCLTDGNADGFRDAAQKTFSCLSANYQTRNPDQNMN